MEALSVPIQVELVLVILKLSCGKLNKNTNPPRLPLPEGVVTVTFPLAPDPTTAVMLVGEFTVKELAGTPPNETEVAFRK